MGMSCLRTPWTNNCLIPVSFVNGSSVPTILRSTTKDRTFLGTLLQPRSAVTQSADLPRSSTNAGFFMVLCDNGRIDRWARGDLDTSQGRVIEPFGPMLGSQINFGLSRIAIRSLSLVLSSHSTSSGVLLQSRHAFQTFNANLVHRTACIRSVAACRYRALVTA